MGFDKWLSLQWVCCFYLTGVIWIIQLIHYPQFAFITEKDFARFHSRHTTVMGAVVGPAMIVELLTAVILCFQKDGVWIINLVGVVIIWIVTFFSSVPSHNRLSAGKDLGEIHKLVRANWIRTAIWTTRSLIFLALLFQAGMFCR